MIERESSCVINSVLLTCCRAVTEWESSYIPQVYVTETPPRGVRDRDSEMSIGIEAGHGVT